MVQLSGHWVRKKSKNIVHAFWKNLAQKSDRHGRISDLASKGFIYLGGVFVFNFFFNFSYLFLKVFIESVAVLLLFYVLSVWPQGTQDLSSPSRDQTCTPGTGRWSLTQWTVREVPFIFTEMQLVDNVVLVSGVQQRDSEYVFCFLHSLPLQVITRYSVELELCFEWESPIQEPSNFPSVSRRQDSEMPCWPWERMEGRENYKLLEILMFQTLTQLMLMWMLGHASVGWK